MYNQENKYNDNEKFPIMYVNVLSAPIGTHLTEFLKTLIDAHSQNDTEIGSCKLQDESGSLNKKTNNLNLLSP